MSAKPPGGPGGGRRQPVLRVVFGMLAILLLGLLLLRLWPGLVRVLAELEALGQASFRAAASTPLALLVPLVLGLAVFLAYRRARRRRRGPRR